MQVRAGKYGDEKVFIIYLGTTYFGGNSLEMQIKILFLGHI